MHRRMNIYAHIYIDMSTNMHVFMCMYEFVYVYVRIHICASAYVCVCMYIHMCMCVDRCVSVTARLLLNESGGSSPPFSSISISETKNPGVQFLRVATRQSRGQTVIDKPPSQDKEHFACHVLLLHSSCLAAGGGQRC